MQDDFTLLLLQLLYSTFPSRAMTGDYEKINFNVDTIKSARALWVVAKDENVEASGFGALRKISEAIAQLKIVFLFRGAFIAGTVLLRCLKGEEKSLGYNVIRLEISLNHYLHSCFLYKP